MIFPIGDDQVAKGHFPFFSYALIVLTLGVFIWQWQLPSQAATDAFAMTYGAVPAEIWEGRQLYSLLTSIFLHAGWMHLLGNMVFLWVFADNIEATVGNFRFLLFYLLGGIVATAAHCFFNPYSPVPCVGASGAIAATLGAYLVLFPHSRIKMFFILLFSTFRIPAYFFLGFWIIQQVISVALEKPTPENTHEGVAWWAHIGGFVYGLVVGFYFRRAHPPTALHLDDAPLPPPSPYV